MARELLTVKQLDTYKGDDVLRDGDGLMLRGSRWVLRVRVHGKRHDLGLGGWPKVGLKQARQKADAARQRARRGVPAHIVGEGKTTFRRAWEQFWEIKAPTLGSARHRGYWVRTMQNFALPKLGDRDVADIRAAEVVEVLRPIWTTKPETARRVLQRVKAVFGWGIFAELRERANPCDGVSKVLGHTRMPTRHFRSMPYHEVPAFFQQLRAMPTVASRSCLAFAILCALRSGEARHAQWDWLVDGLLIVPAEFTKMRRTHAVPLSTGAKVLLDEARTWGGPLIFPGRQGG
jgi:integrase